MERKQWICVGHFARCLAVGDCGSWCLVIVACIRNPWAQSRAAARKQSHDHLAQPDQSGPLSEVQRSDRLTAARCQVPPGQLLSAGGGRSCLAARAAPRGIRRLYGGKAAGHVPRPEPVSRIGAFGFPAPLELAWICLDCWFGGGGASQTDQNQLDGGC